MPESSEGGDNPPERERDANDGQTSRRNNRGRRNATPRESRFEGSHEDLKGSVYDVTAGKDTFLKTTRKIAEYVGREYSDAGEYRLAMINLHLVTLVEPPFPADGTDTMAVEIWKMSRRTYNKKVEGRERNEQRVYALTLGQCSQALRNRMEAHQDWTATDQASNVIGLLTIVQVCMTLRQTRKHEVHSLFEAETLVLTYKQNKKTSNHEYYEKFKDNVATAERLGSNIGMQPSRIASILRGVADDPDVPTDIERLRAQDTAKDEYLAICFLMNSDMRRYGGLIRDIENEHTRGTNTYPDTLTGSYDYLVNYKTSRLSSNDRDEGGLAFYNEDDQSDSGRGRGGRGRGRGGRGGRGRGQGGRGGRGREGQGRGGRGEPAADAPTEDAATDSATDNAQFLLDNAASNLDNDEDYSPPSVGTTDSCFQMLEQANRLDGNMLLIDSCSSVNLICNSELLHNIVTVDWHMRVRCNAGVRTTNQQGRLGSFPEPVWYNPKGVANILSLNSVKKHYRVTYDSAGSDAFIVTDTSNSLELHFKPTKNGLYALRGPSSDGEEKWSFVNTVADNKDMYTKREIRAATRARQVQNIMMFPSTRQLMDISDKHTL